jgi:hypothetical protein
MSKKISDELRKCPLCKQIKNIGNFYKSKKYDGGFSNYCRECTVISNKEHRNPIHANAYRRKRYAANPEPYRAKSRAIISKMREEDPAKLRAKKFFDVKSQRHPISNDITREYIANLFRSTKYCECCGKVLNLFYTNKNKQWYKGNPNSPSIDRIDNNRGYTKDNIAVICWECNHRKTDLTEKDLIIFLNYIKRFKHV